MLCARYAHVHSSTIQKYTVHSKWTERVISAFAFIVLRIPYASGHSVCNVHSFWVNDSTVVFVHTHVYVCMCEWAYCKWKICFSISFSVLFFFSPLILLWFFPFHSFRSFGVRFVLFFYFTNSSFIVTNRKYSSQMPSEIAPMKRFFCYVESSICA